LKGVRPMRLRGEHQKALMKKFEEQLYGGKHSRWSVWADFITMTACTLSIADVKQRKERDELYANTARKYSEEEMVRFSEMFSDLIVAYEENPAQDLLGELFMALELNNDHKGQFFTPYNVCVMMAKMCAGDLKKEIERKGYISVNDCCCGAGALLIAFANETLEQGVNYQQYIEFVAQDIDFTAAMMCYIQLSLLGCAGYVIVGNTLTTPPTEPLSNQNVWYTPLYFIDTWQLRRAAKKWKTIFSSLKEPAEPTDSEPPKNETTLVEKPGGQLSFF